MGRVISLQAGRPAPLPWRSVPSSDVTIAVVMRVTSRDRRDSEAIERVLAVPVLAAQWRRPLARRSSPLADEFGIETY